MQFIECEQGTQEWFDARIGVSTASRFCDAIDRIETLNEQQARYVQAVQSGVGEADAREIAGYKSAPKAQSIVDALAGRPTSRPSAAALSYADEIAIERISGEMYGDTYQTYAMKRGSEMERWARVRYEELYGCEISEAGVLLSDDKAFGYSSDGYRDDGKGCIEIKTPESLTKVRRILTSDDISEYLDQIHGGLWLSRKMIETIEFCDLVLYVPPLSGIGNDIYVKRVHFDEAIVAKLEADLLAHEQRVREAEKFWRTAFRRDGIDATATSTAAAPAAAPTLGSEVRKSLASMLDI